MGVANTTVRGPMTAANAVVGPYRYRRASTPHSTVRVMLYGTFVGTFKLQTSDPDQGVWVDEPTGSYTAATAQVFEPGGDCDIRWVCSAYTSGTAIGAVINGTS